MEPLEQRIAPAVFLVSSLADSGNGSLRDAIDRANTAPGADTIQFQIPGGGLQTILLQSALPTITEAVTIDGYSQPGSQANTLTTGNNAVLQIELKGGNLEGDGLRISGGGTTIRGLIINGFGVGGQGIEIVGGGGNVIEGCFIGTDSTGNLDLGNLGGGILINGSSSNRVGGPTPAARNVISGNDSAGIEISGTGAGNIFVNNYIGTNAAGTAALPNTIGILLGGSETRIGGTLTAERNIISGNTTGIQSNDGAPLAGVSIQGNYIGTNATGSVAVSNNIGLLLDGGSGIYIGGDDDDDGADDGNIGARNVISGNITHGISLSTPDSSLRIQGNYIGTNAAGTSGLGNGQNGIQTDGGSGPYVIGGSSAGAGNLISGNGMHGIFIGGDGGNKLIQGNQIGTDASGKTAISNAEDGIRMAGGGNIVGGTTPAERNLISGNKGNGIGITGGGSNSFQGNYIGTQIDGTSPLSNGVHGIFIAGSVDDNQIGSIGNGTGNVIAYNGADGIYVVAGVENTIRGNSIFGNADLGIDLGTDGVTPNDLNDGDDGANLLQNYPVLTGVSRVSASFSITGTLQSVPQGTFTIDFYSSPTTDSSGFGEGRTYLGSTTVSADVSGNANFSLTTPVQLATGSYISATATRADGNTSEFSAALVVGGEFIWDGGGGADTSWFNPLNWDRDSGVPGPDDIATLNINATITINSDVQVGILNQSAGTITGTAALSVIEGFNWSGGTQAGTGTTSIPAGATRTDPGAILTISGGPGKTLDGRTLDVQGTALVTGTGTVTLTNGAIINNGGIFELQSDADFLYQNNGSPAVQFNNLGGGLLRKTAGTGMTEFGGFSFSFNNSGEVEVQTGLIRVNGSGGSGLGAAFRVAPGAEFEFNTGTYNLAGVADDETAILISGGGVISITGGTVNLGDTFVFDSGSLVKVIGGTLTTNGTIGVSSDARLEQTGGTLGGTGLLAIEGEYKWTGGTQAGTGRTLIAIGGKLDIGGSDLKFLDQRTLDNEGQTTVTGTGGIMLGNAAKINNSGLFDIQGDADFNYTNNGSPAVAFNNLSAGILRKSVGTQASAFTNAALSFNNFGKVEVLTGALRFTGSGGTHTNGTFSVAPNAVLEFANGAHTFNGGTSFEGGGSVLISGGDLTLAAAPPSFVPLPGLAVVATGTGLIQTGGTVSGGGTLSIAGAFVWSGGTQNGVGVTRIESGATLEIAGDPGKTLSQRTLEVLGTARVTGTGSLTLNSGAAIINRGLFELQSDADFIYPNDGSAAVQFTNQIGATLRKLAGTGISEFGGSNFNFNNSGTVDVRTGTIRAAGSGGSGSGPTFLVSPGAVFEFGAGTYNLTPNGSSIVSFAGGGVVAFNGATVNLGTTLVSGTGTQLHLLGGVVNANATIDLPAATRLEHTAGTLGGAGTLLVGGTYQWSGGTQAGTGVTQIAPAASIAISGASNKSLDQRTLDLRGGTTMTGDGNLVLSNGAIINNTGLFDLQSDADFTYPNNGSAAVVFNNLVGGTLRKSGGSGATEFNNASLSFNNSGTVEVQTGSLRFTGSGGVHTDGTFDIQTLLEFGAGNHSFTGANSFKSGQVLVTGGTLSVAGTATVQAGAALLQSGGTITGAGSLSIAGNFIWSGGTQDGTGTTAIQSGALAEVAGASGKTLAQRKLEVLGTARVTGTGNLTMTSGAVISNSGLFELQSDADFLYPNDGSPAVQFMNLSGSFFYKEAGTAITEFGGSNMNFNNAGFVGIQTGTILFASGFTQTAGTLAIGGGNIEAGTPLSLQGGELIGSGTITGNVSNTGATIRPGGNGQQAGTLIITGNYTQGTGGTLAVDLGGTITGTFDVLAVQGTAILGGTLDITNIGGFTPGVGHEFRVVSSANNPGVFTTLSGQTTGLAQTADSSGLVINTLAAPTQPDLVLTSTDGVNETTPGSVLIYTFTYSNSGTRISNGVRLTETLPVGTSFNPAASSPGWTEVVAGTGIYTFLIGSLAPGAGGNVTFAVTVDAAAPAGLNDISNSATISDDGQNGIDATPANNTATDSTTLNASPDLQISIASDSTIAKRGGNISYFLSYQNIGNQNAAGVVLTQSLPQNASFNATASTVGWTETSPGSRVYQLNIGDLPAGTQDTATFAIQFAANLPTSVAGATTVVSIDDNQLNGADPTPQNNSAELSTPVYQGVYILAPGVPVRLKDAAPPTVRVFNIATGVEAFHFDAYESTYRDSVRLAVGDINGDGFDDIITSKRTGTGQIRVFDGLTGTQFEGPLGQIDPFDGLTRASRGAFVASGDVTGDGRDDIIAGSALGGGTVKIYDGVTGTLLSTYQPFGPKFKGGVRVAVGDVNGDGKDDVIVGQGSAGSQVKVYDGITSNVLHNFKVGPKTYRGGVFVSSGDFDGDGRADILTGRDIGSSPIVETFSGLDHHKISSILAFNAKFKNGVRVSAADVNLDGIADIIVTSGTKNRSAVKVFDGQTGQPVLNFEAFPDFPDSSLFVASSTTVLTSGNGG